MAKRVLHIGVDARELLGKPTGVGRYLDGLLRAWDDGTFPHHLTLFAPGSPPAGLPTFGGRLHWQSTRGRGGTWWEQTTLTRAARRAGIDVFFGAGYTAPLRLRCPLVLAVYDVSFWPHPEWFPKRQGWRRRRITRAAARRADAIVTISEFSAGEITKYLDVPRTRIHLAPPGAPPLEPAPPRAAREPVVLFVGSLFNRRHVPVLIRAFARATAGIPEARLILIGDNRTSPRMDPAVVAAGAGIAARVEWRAYVDDRELAEAYGRARAFAFLSEYEGFAIPPMEALAHGVPPVMLDTPVAREIYGEGAILVPQQEQSVADALAALLTDDATHARVLTAGRERLARYSWPETARRVQQALEHAARTGRGA